MIATQNRAAMQGQIVRAFLAGKKKSLGTGQRMGGGYGTRYTTDGTTLRVWGNVVSERRRGAVHITDAGWLTLLTRNVLNEIMEQLGVKVRIYTKRGKWRIWNYETKQEQDWQGRAVIKGGAVRILPERGRPGIVFPGYTRRTRPVRYIPLPPGPPKPRMLFNLKARANLHAVAERTKASKLFRRVYGIAYNAINRRNWTLAVMKYGVMWGLWHAASIERPPLTKLVRSWYGAIKEIERHAKVAGAPDFWTRR